MTYIMSCVWLDYMVKYFQCKNCVGSSPKTKKCVASFLVPGDIITSPVNRRGLFFCPLHPKGNAAIFLPEIGGAGDLSMQKLLQFSQKTDFNLVMLMGNDNFKIRVLLSILVEDLL